MRVFFAQSTFPTLSSQPLSTHPSIPVRLFALWNIKNPNILKKIMQIQYTNSIIVIHETHESHSHSPRAVSHRPAHYFLFTHPFIYTEKSFATNLFFGVRIERVGSKKYVFKDFECRLPEIWVWCE